MKATTHAKATAQTALGWRSRAGVHAMPRGAQERDGGGERLALGRVERVDAGPSVAVRARRRSSSSASPGRGDGDPDRAAVVRVLPTGDQPLRLEPPDERGDRRLGDRLLGRELGDPLRAGGREPVQGGARRRLRPGPAPRNSTWASRVTLSSRSSGSVAVAALI